MSKDIATSIARNATVMMGSQVVTWVSTFILMIFLPRSLGSEEFGRLYLAMSIAMIAQVFVDFGGVYYISKEIARDRSQAPSLIANSMGLRILLGVFTLLVLALFSVVAGYSWRVQALILILAAAKLWEGPLAVLVSAFQGFEQMIHRSVVSVVEKVFVTAVGISALMMGGSALTMTVIMAVSTLLSCLVGFRRLRRFVPHLPPINWQSVWPLMRVGVPYLLMAIFAVIYYRINAVMLSLTVPDEVVGWFGAAFRFFDILMFLPSILSMAVFPVLARTSGEKSTVTNTTIRSLEFIVLAGIPLAVGTYAFADDIIALLFGAQAYAGSAAVLKTLAPGLLLVYIDFVLVTALIAMDRQKHWSVVALAAIPVSIGLNVLLIPYCQEHFGNGGIGSAVATNITELGILMSAVWLLPPGFFAGRMWGQAARILTAGVGMVGAIVLLRLVGMPWMLQAAAGGTAFVGVALLVGVVRPDERKFILAHLSPAGLRRLFRQEEPSEA